MVFGELFIGNPPFARRREIKLGLNLRQASVGRKPRFDRDTGLTALTNFLQSNRTRTGKFRTRSGFAAPVLQERRVAPSFGTAIGFTELKLRSDLR
jgi:hypothetical protein